MKKKLSKVAVKDIEKYFLIILVSKDWE